MKRYVLESVPKKPFMKSIASAKNSNVNPGDPVLSLSLSVVERFVDTVRLELEFKQMVWCQWVQKSHG